MKTFNIYLTIFLSSLLLISCSDSSPVDPGDDNENASSSKYIIAASPTAPGQEGVADYLLTADSLSGGSVSTLDNGIEQDGTYRYYVTNNNKYFSLLYGQGNPGAVTTYRLNSSGKLNELSDFQSETVQAFAPVDDDILMMKTPRSISDPTAYWYRLNTNNSQFVSEGQINVIDLADNGEGAFFSWMTQVGNRVFAPFFTITGEGNNNFSTNYPDQAWVAVYSYPEMELQKVIKDDRTSFIGRYFTKGLSVDEHGDVYAFSSSIAMNDNGEMISTKPSAITRINSGTTKFDQDYLFNLKKASGGYYATDHVYASDGYFLVMMKNAEEKAPYAVGHKLAVVNAYDQTFEWITGLPKAADISNITSMNNYVSEDGRTIYTGISTADGSFVYAIDMASATATQGLEVEGGIITSINKLNTEE